MWLLVWAIVLVLVHVQFMHCRAITVTALKILETSVIVLMMRLWSEMPEHIELLWNTTNDMVKERFEL
jgi:hypothetical protein|tara:strand:+ start:10601 stop:10804 length:204 start_codon:yes stop_codon:yes gene_type:complete